MYLASFGNNQKGLVCRKQVKTVADVKGLKIRAVGATTRLITELGAVPVVMGPPDATTALERGTIDCVHAVVTWLKNFGYWDVAKYMLETPMGAPRTISTIVYGRRAWDKMTRRKRRPPSMSIPMHLARMVYLVNVKADELIKEKAIKEKHVQFTEGGKDFIDFVAKFRMKERALIPQARQGKARRDQRQRDLRGVREESRQVGKAGEGEESEERYERHGRGLQERNLRQARSVEALIERRTSERKSD